MTEMKTHDDRPTVDFNHKSPSHGNGVDVYRELRSKCPVGWSDSNDGHWVVSRYEDVLAVMRNNDTFVSGVYEREDGTRWGGLRIPYRDFYRLYPDESDRPAWDDYRNIMNSWFTPTAVEDRRERLVEFINQVIDDVIERGECDFAIEIAGRITAEFTFEILGLDVGWAMEAARTLHMVAYASGNPELEQEFAQRLKSIFAHIEREIAIRRESPRDDLTSEIVTATRDGEPYSDEETLGMLLNVILGGLDTTMTLLTFSLVWLADHREWHDRLLTDRRLLRKATEEFVRWVTPVGSVRRSARVETEVGGQTMDAEEALLVAFKSANRDESVFENPDEVDFERAPNPHIGFGSGIHRCLGSHLARAVFQETICAVLRRMPDYEIDYAGAEKFPVQGTAEGYIALPIRFTPGTRLQPV